MKVKVKGHSYSLLNVESNKYEQSLNFIHKEKKEDSDELEVISDGTTNEEVLECLIDNNGPNNAKNIADMKAGLLYFTAGISKLGSAPTRMGEFLACGIPVIGNRGVGDMASLIEKYQVGITTISDVYYGKAYSVWRSNA